MTEKLLKGLNFVAIFIAISSCKQAETTIEITNPLNAARTEVVELPISQLPSDLQSGCIVLDEKGKVVESQLTSDSLLLFLSTIGPKSTVHYKLTKGDAAAFDTICTGRIYPERMDDLAWENENVAFRAYGPTMQKRGERGYGYDLFLKHGPTAPVVEALYAMEMVPGWHHRVDSLRQAGLNEAADSLYNFHSYHKDSGLGMDCYAVGPTLGAGVSALLRDDNSFAYPWCYNTAEVLDQGPLRFRAKLIFAPVEIDGDSIIEERVITLDAKENLNHAVVRYHGLSEPRTIVSGVPLRDPAPNTANTYQGFLSYCDPASQENNPQELRGKLYVGLAYPFTPDSITTVVDNGQPHLVAYSTYLPDEEYEYYWGYGWNKGNVADYDAWNAMLAERALRSRFPLILNIVRE